MADEQRFRSGIGRCCGVGVLAVFVRSGPVRRWIDPNLVERVRPVRTLLSAPALSRDRLEISGGFGASVVSPRDQAGFVRGLRRVAPRVRLEGSLESLSAG